MKSARSRASTPAAPSRPRPHEPRQPKCPTSLGVRQRAPYPWGERADQGPRNRRGARVTADVVHLPELMTEAEAARRLGVSAATIQRERRKRAIGHVLIGGRPKYTPAHLAAYITSKEVAPCHAAPAPTDLPSSAAIGSAGAPGAACGAAPGSTPHHVRLAEHHSALTILQSPRRPSPPGSPAKFRPAERSLKPSPSAASSSATIKATSPASPLRVPRRSGAASP